MPGAGRGPLEGVGSKTQRDERAYAEHGDGIDNAAEIAPHIGTGKAGYVDSGQRIASHRGTPQGGNLSRRGKFIVGRRTSRKKFRAKCKELNLWLKHVRNSRPAKEWWPILAAKLRGHCQYYGVSGNMPSVQRFYREAVRLTLKWLNRRSQRRSFNWKGFHAYLKHYPLPTPRIVHNLYTLSPVK